MNEPEMGSLPGRQAVIAVLNALVSHQMSRSEAANWAQPFVVDDHKYRIPDPLGKEWDEQLWEAICDLMAADLEHEPGKFTVDLDFYRSHLRTLQENPTGGWQGTDIVS